MSQIQCTAPLDIVKNTQTDKICKLKCAYQFDYPRTTLTIINGVIMLIMIPERVTTPPVIYNDNNYEVIWSFLAQPSIHSYNGQKAEAELIIFHSSISGKYMCVCIPIKSSSSSADDSANYFDLILSAVTLTAPSAGGTAIFNNSTFSLSKLVPMKPYYSYTGADFFSKECYPGQLQIDYLVYHYEHAITMSPQGISTLQRLLKPSNQVFPQPLPESVNYGGIFYNPIGPISPNKPDIYIDCQPTGDDGEIIMAAKRDPGSLFANNPLKKLMNMNIIKQFMKILIGLILMVFIWKIMIRVVGAVTFRAVNPKQMVSAANK